MTGPHLHEGGLTSPVHASDCALHNGPAWPAGACDCGVLARGQRIALRRHAFDCARFLAAAPTIEQQLADAEVLASAIGEWASEPRLRDHVHSVFVTACAEATTAQEAVDLAARVFRFLVADEVGPPAAEGG